MALRAAAVSACSLQCTLHLHDQLNIPIARDHPSLSNQNGGQHDEQQAPAASHPLAAPTSTEYRFFAAPHDHFAGPLLADSRKSPACTPPPRDTSRR